MDTALNRALRDAQHLRGFFVGESLRLHQDKRLALGLRELRDGGIEAEACEVLVDYILRSCLRLKQRKSRRRSASQPLAPAVHGDGMQVGRHFCPSRKPWPTLKRGDQRLLGQVFGIGMAAPTEPQAQPKNSVSMVVEPALPVFIHAR